MQHSRNDELKIKRFGQVFSGKLVGDLLVELLPSGFVGKTIIDPMVGQGDLLKAAHEKYLSADLVLGIDIDEDVISKCTENIPGAKILKANAFNSTEINMVDGWDLVITNPPYVRYQTLRRNPEIGLPDGRELRQSLVKHIQQSMILNDQEKELYLEITKGYSGLSDMAVPSWILCASIVKLGGYMAMVVPETWLNRDYALPIHYLLLRCFEVVVIARDIESTWFENAEVRTCLVICRRKENEAIKNSFSDTIVLEIGNKVKSEDSLVGNLKFENSFSYEALRRILAARVNYSEDGFAATLIPMLAMFPGLVGRLSNQKWIFKEDKTDDVKSDYIPSEIKEILGDKNVVEYDSLESLGWSIGQGLRTGANEFFYAKIISEDEMSVVETQSWHGRKITISAENLRKALKKRSDINGLVVNYDDIEKCILYIQHQVRQADYQRLTHKLIDQYALMDSALDDYIRCGEEYVSPSHKKVFKELSAVITNEKKTDDGYERFWYMLPPLKKRHVPNLCIPRVCGDSPETLFVNQIEEKDIVVDANFITLWNPDVQSQVAAFALLNSTWAKLMLEIIGTVMGGGALKIEASHIRKMVFPHLNIDKQRELVGIGKTILKRGEIDNNIQEQIDRIVISPYGTTKSNFLNIQLRELLTKKRYERTGRKYDE